LKLEVLELVDFATPGTTVTETGPSLSETEEATDPVVPVTTPGDLEVDGIALVILEDWVRFERIPF